MGYDNSQRFRFFVMQDCVLPKQDGGMQRLKRGSIVVGAHYVRFTKTGILQSCAVEEKPALEPAPVSESAPVTKPVLETKSVLESQVAPAASPLTREELESMTKRDLIEKYDPSWVGTKGDLITKILKG